MINQFVGNHASNYYIAGASRPFPSDWQVVERPSLSVEGIEWNFSSDFNGSAPLVLKSSALAPVISSDDQVFSVRSSLVVDGLCSVCAYMHVETLDGSGSAVGSSWHAVGAATSTLFVDTAFSVPHGLGVTYRYTLYLVMQGFPSFTSTKFCASVSASSVSKSRPVYQPNK